MTFLCKNNAVSRLKFNVGSGDTTLTVLAGEGARFPLPGAGDYFAVTLDDRRSGQIEICKCIARSGDVLTIIRAQEGTVAQDFAAEATVANRFTAGTIDYILAETGYSESEADDRFVNTTGDTMIGQLALPSPSLGSSATNKDYVDGQIATRAPEAPNDGFPYVRKNLNWSISDWSSIVSKPSTFPPSPHSHPQSDILGLVTDLSAKEDKLSKGVAYGYASLDANAKVPAAQLPAYVDDVQEYANLLAFPTTGDAGIIYVALDTNKTYRWSGSTYVEISPSPGTTDNVPEGSTNLYFTNGRASLAAPVQTVAGRVGAVVLTKADVNLSNVDNTSDLNKPISTATQVALNAKLGDAPTDGTQYVRKNATWTAVAIPPGNLTQDTPPSSPVPGQLWYETDSGNTYIWFDDGSSQQWVQINVVSDDAGLHVLKAGDTMTGPLLLPVGSVSAPGLQFSTVTGGTGLWASGSGSSAQINFAINGSTRGRFDQNGFTTFAPIRVSNGSVTAPSLSFSSDTNTGWYWAAADDMRATANGTDVLKLLGSDRSATFFGPAIMATPTTAIASINLPPGVAPTAPTNGDMWGTATGLFARVNGVTYNLTNTFPEAPTDGQQYARQNAAWAAVTIPPGTIMSDTAPGSPANGQMWWETDTGRLFIYYNDGNTAQWVQVNAPATTLPTAQAAENYNRIINGDFRISQENGVATQTANGTYPADQWQNAWVHDGTMQTAQLVAAAGAGYPSNNTHLWLNCSVADTSLAAGQYVIVQQALEGLRMADLEWGTAYSRGQLVLRFTAYGGAGAPIVIAVSVRNAASDMCFVQNVTILAGWNDYVVAIPEPPTSTWPSDNTRWGHLSFCLACGTTYQTPTPGAWASGTYWGTAAQGNFLGAAANNMRIANVGLYFDPGDTGVPPAWQTPDYVTELVKCQRYFQNDTGAVSYITQYAASGPVSVYVSWPLPVQMRTAPSITISGTSYTNASGIASSATSPKVVRLSMSVTAAGLGFGAYNWAANARM